MRGKLVWLGAALALLASVPVLRIVVHLYRDHGHLDLFHLFVGIGFIAIGALLARRALAGTRP